MNRACRSLIRRDVARLAIGSLAFAGLTTSSYASAQEVPVVSVSRDSASRLTVGAFVDAYYAWDMGRPPLRDRAFAGGTPFTTQPSRHNEFNVNLAYLEVMRVASRHRGRLALQFGTSVQSNYAGEPSTGRISGPSVQQFLQEAYAGVKLGERTWLDAGVFAANVGMEGWVSRDNLTYTRSLVADYSPYYSAGVRVTHPVTSTLTARVDLVNGWQNISENNDGKGLGVRLDWVPRTGTTVSYFSLVTDEAPVGEDARVRMLHGVGTVLTRGRWTLLGEVDLGGQEREAGVGGWSRWFGMVATARVAVRPNAALIARIERFDDPDQGVVATGSRPAAGGMRANPAFRGNGASLGVDITAAPGVLWRTELRGFGAREAVFPSQSVGGARRTGGVLVTSLAVTL
jgi:hypothetical protein